MELPLWAWIMIGIVCSLLGLWILLFLVSLFSGLHFRKHLRGLSNPINVLLMERREAMLALAGLIRENKVAVDPEDLAAIDLLERVGDFQALDKKERDRRVLGFVHASHNLLTVAERSPRLRDLPAFRDLQARIEGIEDVYRQKSALYNSDVIGYNYWVGMFSCRRVFESFGLKKMEFIV